VTSRADFPVTVEWQAQIGEVQSPIWTSLVVTVFTYAVMIVRLPAGFGRRVMNAGHDLTHSPPPNSTDSPRKRVSRYCCPGWALPFMPPVRPLASTDLVDFVDAEFVSVATALLAKRSRAGLDASSTTDAAGPSD
jgi:hypothetical protein